jgi:hypothetical protein
VRGKGRKKEGPEKVRRKKGGKKTGRNGRNQKNKEHK